MQSDNLDIILCNPPYGLSSRWRTTVKMAFQESSSSEERRTAGPLHGENYRVAPRYSREKPQCSDLNLSLNAVVSRFAFTQIAHYAAGEIAATRNGA